MRKIYVLFTLLCLSFLADAQSRDGTCDAIDSLIVIDTLGNLTLLWNRNDTALAYNYRYRLLGDTAWETDATLDTFLIIDETGECVEYEVGISTVCPFDTSTYTLDTVISFCPSANRNILLDPSALRIYPVPFVEELNIMSSDPSLLIEHTIVRTINGQQVWVERGVDGSSIKSSTHDWPDGVYLIEIKTNKGWHFQKVLKL